MTPTYVTHDDAILNVHWENGARMRFHAMWLRDNARGADFRHPENDQRLFDLTEMPAAVTIQAATIVHSAVRVHFGPDEITVDYEADFLWEYAYDRAPADDDRRLWRAEQADRLVRHDYAEVAADPAAKKAWMDDLIRDGISLLANVPTVEGTVLDVAGQFGFVRETNYGRLFEVRSEARPISLVYTPIGLNVRTDNPYRAPVPGLQLLHCLVNDAEGGDSVFVDGFKVAEVLRLESPDAFDLLTRHWAPFRFRDDSADLFSRGPYIQLDDRSRVVAVRYNNRFAAPLDLPFEAMDRHYEALRTFANLLHRPDGEMRLKLKAGELVTFDNERVLHGRNGFAGGARHLQGCYADKDSLRSLSAVLARPAPKEAAE